MAVRLAFIGTGGIAQAHLSNLQRLPDAEVVALCDVDAGRIEVAVQNLNRQLEQEIAAGAARRLDARTYTDARAMLRAEKPDAVYICVPPFAHGAPEETVLEANLPFLVEKPVALDLGVARRILAEVERRGIITAVGYQLRYAPAVQKAKEWLQGQTVAMAIALRFGGTPSTPWWRIQARSGGQLVEMATHQMDLLRYLVGEVETIYAAAATRVMHRKYPDFDIFDVNSVTLRFENGAVGTFANACMADYGSPPEARGLHLLCEDFALSVGANAVRLQRRQGVEDFKEPSDAMRLEDEAFVAAVGSGDPSRILSPYADGLRTLAVTLAGEASARRGHPIRMREFAG